jgi:hypothetical protein
MAYLQYAQAAALVNAFLAFCPAADAGGTGCLMGAIGILSPLSTVTEYLT